MRTLSTGEFHGARRDTRRVGDLTFAETEYAPGHTLPLHAHEQPFFSLLLRGSFRERLEGGSRDCVPTSLVYYPEREPHSESFDRSGGRAFNVEISRDWLAALREQGVRQPEHSFETRASSLNWLATRLYRDFVSEGETPDVGLEETVLEMLAEMARLGRLGREATPPFWLGRVRDVLHARWHEVIPISDLAREAGVHPVHMARVFRRHHGCTIGEYVRRLRAEHACAELARGTLSLSALAYRAGFSDQAHFTRCFKAVTGLPPGEYRRLLAS